MSLRHYLESVYAPARRLSWSSLQTYLALIERFERFLARPAIFDDLDTATIRTFTTWLQERYAERTTRCTLECLIALARHYHRASVEGVEAVEG